MGAECSAQLKAGKLIFLGCGIMLYDMASDRAIHNMSLKTATRLLCASSEELPSEFRLGLQCSVNAL